MSDDTVDVLPGQMSIEDADTPPEDAVSDNCRHPARG